MDRSIKIIQQLKQVFKPYCMMFKELKGGGGGKKQLPSQYLCKENKNITKILKLCLVEGTWSIICGFYVFRFGSWNLTPTKSEG
jgi:hypothetical protein